MYDDLQNLESMLASERAGINPNGEGRLKDIISTNNLRQNPILFGFEISLQRLRQWRLEGKAPDSDNEVDECINRTAHSTKRTKSFT